MARFQFSPSALRLSHILFAVLFLIPASIARPHNTIQKRDIFSDIGNFFDNLEMQVDMTIFQPVQNFFTEAAADVLNFVILPAENFFMQANKIVFSGLYNFDMLVADIGIAVEKDVIDAAVSVQNLAIHIGQEVTTDVNTVVSDVAGEFNNVITPALNQVGQEIGQGLNVAGADILQGLEVAGQFIENHPELVAQIFLTVAITAISIIQPEFVGADGALIGDLVTEAAADSAGEVIASEAAEGTAETLFDTGAEEVVTQADMPLFESISNSLDKYTSYFNNVNRILDLANDVNSTLTDVANVFPVTAQTISDITNLVGPLANSTAGLAAVYGQLDQVLNFLNKAGKIVALVGRDAPALEERKQKTSTSSTTTAPTTLRTSTSATSTQSIGAIVNSVGGFTTATTSVTSSTATVSSSTSHATSTVVPSNIPLPILTQWVQHHWLNQTVGGKTYVKQQLKNSFMNHLNSGNFTSQALKTSPQLQPVLTTMNSALVYPAPVASYRQSISHQIAMGSATAYNAKNLTVKIQMDANAPKDVCLGLAKQPCFGNQIGQPYCKYGCASRWYNQLNINPLHY